MDIVNSIKLVLEIVQSDAITRSKQHGYTRGDVASGYGKFAGSVGSIPGVVIGHYAGKHLINSPKKSADLTHRAHRLGIMLSKKLSLHTLGVAGAGAVIGGIAHAIAQHHGLVPSRDLGNGVTFHPGWIEGSAAGASIAALAQNSHAGYTHAKKMGYGKVGQVGNSLSSWAALTKPKSQK